MVIYFVPINYFLNADKNKEIQLKWKMNIDLKGQLL